MDLADVYAARARIAPFVRHTPLEFSPELGVYFKLENLQQTGSFKPRGALNRVLSMTADEQRRGAVAASAGNHAQGVALGCARLGVPLIVVMPVHTPRTKVEAVRRLGADIRLWGETYDAAEAEARRLERETGRVFISPYNDPVVVAGQGTLAIEIMEDLPQAAQVVIPVGGGGLIAGMGLALKAISPAIRVVGVTSYATASVYSHVTGNHLPQLPSIAEGLSGEIETDSITIDLARRYVDDWILVQEDELGPAILWLIEAHHLIVEGSGAVGIAAARAGRLARPPADAPTVVVLTGGNLDIELLRTLIASG